MRRATRATAAANPTAAALAMPSTFVAVHVRQALQHAGATGAYSANRLTTGSALDVVRSSTSVDEPGAPEAAHLLDDRQEVAPLLGQVVLDPRRPLGIRAAFEDAVVLERAQPLGQRAWGDAGARGFELGEPACALRQVVHEECRPLRAEQPSARGDRARRRVMSLEHRAHRYTKYSAGRGSASRVTRADGPGATRR